MLKFYFFDAKTFGAFGIDLILHVDALEREISIEHTKHQDSNCPHINLVVIDFLFEDLRRHVGSGAAESIDILIIFATKSQITNFNQIAVGFHFGCITNQQDVFGFYVSVDEIFGVNCR